MANYVSNKTAPCFVLSGPPGMHTGIATEPLVKDAVSLHPLRLFSTAEKAMCTYSEWITGDAAWNMQVIASLSYTFSRVIF